MVGGTVYLLTENRISMNGCGNNQFCSKCQQIASCNLDPAKKQRDTEMSNKGL